MSFSGYLDDKKMTVLACFSGGLFIASLLWLFGLGMGEIILLGSCFVCMAGGMFLFGYLHQRKRILYLKAVMDSLDQKYLFAEIADAPQSELEKAYFKLLKTAMKAMTEEVSRSKSLGNEYREFVEQWIHEMKVPVTGIGLLCENNKSDVTRKIMTQTEIISQGVDRVLYYARLGSVEKDYFIAEVPLRACVKEVIARNKQFFIQNHVSIHTDGLWGMVYSDGKWLSFILNQIVINSVKYRGSRSPVIEIFSEDKGSYMTLAVMDNGLGIKESEIGRVFDKGFVGSNGRAGEHATGIGLYLCRQLCMRLGMGIEIKSEAGQYTTVFLYFPKAVFPTGNELDG